MKLTTDGLVIWEVKTGEADRIISILTPNGLVSACAKGSRRPGSRLCAPTAVYCYSQFELFKGRNMYTVDSAADKLQFVALAADVAALSLAAYLCELLRLLAPVDEDAGDFLSLALTALHLLIAGGDRRIVKSAFELKLLSLAGYMPGLDGCRLCGAPGGRAIAFDPLRGDFVCAECAAGLGLPLNSSGAALAAMRYIVSAEPKRVFSFRLPDAQLAVLSGLTEKYVEQQLERRPATLDFYDVIGRTEK